MRRQDVSACDGFCDEEAKDLQGEDAFIRTEEVLPKLFQDGLSRGRLGIRLRTAFLLTDGGRFYF